MFLMDSISDKFRKFSTLVLCNFCLHFKIQDIHGLKKGIICFAITVLAVYNYEIWSQEQTFK